MKQLFQRTSLFELTVGLFQYIFIFIIQPITFPFINRLHCLIIQLFVIDGNVRLNRSRHLDTNETAATTGTGKQIFLIAGSDKRSITPHFPNRITVRLTQIRNRLLQQMLQESLLTDINLIEFININQEKASQITFRLLLTLKINTVRIAETKFRRQDNATKCRLAIPLRTDQQRRSTITMLPVNSPPMRHHTKEPTVKQFRPMRIITRNQTGQCTNTILSIPTPCLIKIFFDRIVQRNTFRIQKTIHITVPRTNSLFQCIDCNAVAHPFIHRLKAKMNRVTLTIFQIIQHRIVTEFITAFHKLFQQKSRLLLFADAAFLAESLTFLVKIMEYRTNHLFFLLAIIMNHRLPYRFLFGDTRFETMFGKADQQRLQVVPTFPVLHFLKCPVQCRFINLRERLCRLISRLQSQ